MTSPGSAKALLFACALGSCAAAPALAADPQNAAANDTGNAVKPEAPAPRIPPPITATGAARLIPDEVLALDKADPKDARCARLLGPGAGWCGRIGADLIAPGSASARTVSIWLDPPVAVGKSSQTVTGKASFALEASQDCQPVASGSALVVTLPAAGSSCHITITAATTEPGEFRSNVRARDGSGSFDQSSALTVKAAESWQWAFVLIALGAFIGMVVAYLRSIFRPRVAALADALGEVQQYEVAAALARRSGLAPDGSLDPLDAAARKLVDDAKAGRPIVPTDGTPTFSSRTAALLGWAMLAQRARALEAATLAPLRQPFQDALDQVITGSNPSAGLAGVEAALSQALTTQAQMSGPAAKDAMAVSGPVPVPDFSEALLAGIKSVKELDRFSMFAGLVETFFTFVLFALGALLAIWVGNDSWGTTADQIDAVLIGAGAFLGAAAIKTIREGDTT